MKARTFWVVLLIGLVVLTGCGKKSPKVLEPTEVPIPGYDKWVPVVGEWEADDDGVKQLSELPTNSSAYVALEQKDAVIYEYEWTIDFLSTRGTSGPAAGLHILAEDPEHENRGRSYLIWQDKARVTIYRTSIDRLGTFAQFDIPVAEGEKHDYRVVLDTQTNMIKVYRDGELILEKHDPEMYTEGGYLSARTNASTARFYNFKYTVYQ